MTLARFLADPGGVVQVRLSGVQGSVPREEGALMFVSATGLYGTIGGGRLEYMAIDAARAMLHTGRQDAEMDVPLGPEIGQCCGGRVALALTTMSQADRGTARTADAAQRARRPHVHVFGAGHVGRALARLLQFMPVHCTLIDTRAGELALCDAKVERRLSALPEADIRRAQPGSAFVVLTHDHALDFLLTSEALKRGDASYVGLIGSATKRARFSRFHESTSHAEDITRLTCPIGMAGSGDKRPEVIAAFVAAEIMARLTCLPDRDAAPRDQDVKGAAQVA